MDEARKIFVSKVEAILYRDYIGGEGSNSRWVEEVLRGANMEAFFREGYTEEAAAQKIYQDNIFQALIKTERQYKRLPTETAKRLFRKIMKWLKKDCT